VNSSRCSYIFFISFQMYANFSVFSVPTWIEEFYWTEKLATDWILLKSSIAIGSSFITIMSASFIILLRSSGLFQNIVKNYKGIVQGFWEVIDGIDRFVFFKFQSCWFILHCCQLQYLCSSEILCEYGLIARLALPVFTTLNRHRL
jgi:hypothetical protein